MTTVSLAELDAAIRADYLRLCGTFSLRSVPLDIYVVDDGSIDTTAFGTLRCNGTPGYDGQLIVIPVDPGDPGAINKLADEYPPSNFDRNRWQHWRIELWHEVTHQVQDQTLQLWDRDDGSGGHTRGWLEALHDLGLRFGKSAGEMNALLYR